LNLRFNDPQITQITADLKNLNYYRDSNS